MKPVDGREDQRIDGYRKKGERDFRFDLAIRRFLLNDSPSPTKRRVQGPKTEANQDECPNKKNRPPKTELDDRRQHFAAYNIKIMVLGLPQYKSIRR